MSPTVGLLALTLHVELFPTHWRSLVGEESLRRASTPNQEGDRLAAGLPTQLRVPLERGGCYEWKLLVPATKRIALNHHPAVEEGLPV